jgi:hypothetical protein
LQLEIIPLSAAFDDADLRLGVIFYVFYVERRVSLQMEVYVCVCVDNWSLTTMKLGGREAEIGDAKDAIGNGTRGAGGGAEVIVWGTRIHSVHASFSII